MLSNFFKSIIAHRWFYIVGLPVWVFAGFMVAQVAVVALYVGIDSLGAITTANGTVLNAVVTALIYAATVLIIFGVPWVVAKHKTSLTDLGLHRLPTWADIAWVFAGVVAYIVVTSIINAIARVALPFVDFEQVQDVGFSNLLSQSEYILAFLSLVVLAPVAEEVLFRGYLFGKLNKHVAAWVSVIITSVLFAVVHFQWNVSIDVFALSIVLCILRIKTGSVWSSIILHMVKNGVAFYFLFINPSLFDAVSLL